MYCGSTRLVICITCPFMTSSYCKVAERVADERSEPCGQQSSVGYQIRLEKYRLLSSLSLFLSCSTCLLDPTWPSQLFCHVLGKNRDLVAAYCTVQQESFCNGCLLTGSFCVTASLSNFMFRMFFCFSIRSHCNILQIITRSVASRYRRDSRTRSRFGFPSHCFEGSPSAPTRPQTHSHVGNSQCRTVLRILR